MAFAKPISAPACTLAAILALAGCAPFDDSGEVSADQADKMLETLNELEDATVAQNCTGAQENADQLMTQATQVEGTVGDELEDLVSRAQTLVDSDVCTDTGATGAATDEPETEPDRTTTTTTEETTTTQETQPETTTPETDEPSTGDGGEESGGETEPGGGNPPTGPEGNPNESGGIGPGGESD